MLKRFFFIFVFYILLVTKLQHLYSRSKSLQSEDFYEILNVPRDATQKEIRKAFRKLSMEFHPDRDRTPGANERFSKISAAYDVLSDEAKRKIYDMHGHEGLSSEMPNHAESNFFNLFNSFGFEYFNRNHERQREKTESLVFPLYLTLDQLYFGEFFYITLSRPVLCLHVDDCIVPMTACAAPGIKIITQRLGPGFIVQNQLPDSQCVDAQRGWKKNCAACPKGKTELQKVKASVFVEKGMSDGGVITLEGAGSQALGMEPGDVLFHISMIPHPIFKRHKDNLYTTVYLTMLQALTGFSMEFIHLNKKKFTLSKNNVTHDGEIAKMEGWGMPKSLASRGNQLHESKTFYGDMFITYRIKFPVVLSEIQKKHVVLALQNVTAWKHEKLTR